MEPTDEEILDLIGDLDKEVQECFEGGTLVSSNDEYGQRNIAIVRAWIERLKVSRQS